MTKVYYCKCSSFIGNTYAACTAKGVCFVELRQYNVHDFEKAFEFKFNIRPVKDKAMSSEVNEVFQKYFDGSLTRLDLPLDILSGTLFQRKVWSMLKNIPFGQVRSYKWVSEELGMPEAGRAVGNANGKNPIPIIIPCHRVICANGKIGGFSSGMEIKKRLLKHEGVSINEKEYC